METHEFYIWLRLGTRGKSCMYIQSTDLLDPSLTLNPKLIPNLTINRIKPYNLTTKPNAYFPQKIKFGDASFWALSCDNQ